MRLVIPEIRNIGTTSEWIGNEKFKSELAIIVKRKEQRQRRRRIFESEATIEDDIRDEELRMTPTLTNHNTENGNSDKFNITPGREVKDTSRIPRIEALGILNSRRKSSR